MVTNCCLLCVQSDFDLLRGIDDDSDFESHHDEPEADSVKKSEVFTCHDILLLSLQTDYNTLTS